MTTLPVPVEAANRTNILPSLPTSLPTPVAPSAVPTKMPPQESAKNYAAKPTSENKGDFYAPQARWSHKLGPMQSGPLSVEKSF